MKTVKLHCSWLVIGMTAATVALSALAADKPAGKDQAQLRHLQQQLHAAEQEKSQLLQQKTDAETQLKETQEKAADAERKASLRSARLSKELEAVKAEKEAQAAASKAERDALAAKLAQTERALADQRQQTQQLEGAFARQKTALTGCRQRNDRMYKLGNDLLEKYEQKGCFASMLQGEPFTGLKRAQIEKMVEEDREKFDKDQILPAAAPAD
jgi:chromosome segregation ATPase